MILPIGKRKYRTDSRRGFTLVELVLVILLISILVGLSTPLFKRTFSDLELRNISLDIAKMINYAQEMAIVDKIKYKLNFNIDRGEFWIAGRHGKKITLPRGLKITLDAEYIDKGELAFYPDGRSDKAEIKITDRKTGEGRLIKIKGFGSRVEIKRIER